MIFFIYGKENSKQLFRDQGVLIFFILVPLMYPLIYGFIYTNEVVREVPVIVVDDSHSSLSREFIRKVDATADVEIKTYCSNMEEAKQLMKERKAYGLIYVPSNFSKDVALGRQTKVSIYCDMSGLLYYKGILLSATAVSLDMNKNIKISRAGNTTNRQDEITAHPIEYDNVALFNPQNGFAAFLIPAVLILLIQQTLLLGIGLSAGTAREHNRFKDLVPINRHYNGTLRIVMGKGLSYFMVYSIISVYVLCVVPRIFSLNQIGHPDALILFMLPYLAACIFFAMTASIAIRNRETCMLIFVFTSVPLLFISGISWPRAAIPPFWKYVSYIFPSTFGINGFVRINNMGASLNEISTEYKALWIQAGVYFLTTCWVYRWQILRSRKHVLDRYREMKAKQQLSSREITD
jgi:ABC-type multidrug transport system, permease component